MKTFGSIEFPVSYKNSSGIAPFSALFLLDVRPCRSDVDASRFEAELKPKLIASVT
jgi:hypothetical protein